MSPWYFVVHAAGVTAGLRAGRVRPAPGRNPDVAQASCISAACFRSSFSASPVATRLARLPGLTAVTGRWDLAPATFALAFSCAFIGLHASVLLGINVAYPHRQHWAE